MRAVLVAAVVAVAGCSGGANKSTVRVEEPPRVAELLSPERQQAQDRLAALASAAGVAFPLPSPHIVVHKAARELQLMSGDVVVATFHVGLGGDPIGPKEREGDQRTPEGEYHIVTRYGGSAFHRFLGLSYPGVADARRGLEDGLIDERQAQQIAMADTTGVAPPWGTPLGGAVGIHGSGGSSDWTLGCVAVDDEAVDLLWEAVPMGTPVTILP